MNSGKKQVISLAMLSLFILGLFTGCRQSPLLRQEIYLPQEPKKVEREKIADLNQDKEEKVQKPEENRKDNRKSSDTNPPIVENGEGEPRMDVGEEDSDGTLGQVVTEGGIKVEVPKSVANVTTVGEDTQSPHWKSSRTSDGNESVGKWEEELQEGRGTYVWPDGDKYAGEWNYDMFAGQGTYAWSDGDRFEGTWRDDMFQGEGTYTWASGSKYIGQWKAGVKEGQGTYTWANGDVYIGEWKAGVKDGIGIYTWADGSVYEGEWKYGIREGKGTYRGADGILYDGLWSKDKFMQGD